MLQRWFTEYDDNATLSKLLRAQYAEERAEKTDPRSFKLQVPIFKADSSTITAALYFACDNNFSDCSDFYVLTASAT